MSQATFDKQLNLLESQLHELAKSLMDGDSVLLQDASTKFQHLTVELLHLVKGSKRISLKTAADTRRITALANGMASFRENLFRRAAYVDTALGLLIPETKDKATYSGSRMYGSPARRSGSFNAFSA